MFSANLAFLAASSNDSNPPPFTELPAAYGYNTLLIDNTTAALLDMPTPDYVNSIQQQLGLNETWYLSASVNGTVANYNITGKTYINNDSFWNKEPIPDFYYPATDESVVSVRTTLHADWLLYVVLSFQPILTLLMFLSAMFFYSTPIQTGFGIVAILAGIDRDSLDIVEGAGLSGKLAKPVVMDIGIRKPSGGESRLHSGPGIERMLYTLGGKPRKTTKLEKGRKYG